MTLFFLIKMTTNTSSIKRDVIYHAIISGLYHYGLECLGLDLRLFINKDDLAGSIQLLVDIYPSYIARYKEQLIKKQNKINAIINSIIEILNAVKDDFMYIPLTKGIQCKYNNYSNNHYYFRYAYDNVNKLLKNFVNVMI